MDRHFGLYGSSGIGSPDKGEGFRPSLVQKRREKLGEISKAQSIQFSGVLQ